MVGHDKQKKYFNHVIANGALAHAYLFTGPEMIGKKIFAIKLAGTINGRDAANDPDFKFLFPKIADGESKIYIEDARILKSFFSLKPYRGPYKIAVIDDAHCLTAEAANALLKIVEEPPSFSILILITSMPGMLLPTILSRCEEVEFLPASKETVADFLHDREKNNGSQSSQSRQSGRLTDNDKDFLITLVRGRIGLAERLLTGNELANARKSVDDLRKLLTAGIYEKMDYAKKVHEKGDYWPRIDYWLHWVSAHLRNSPKNAKIVKGLIALSAIISQPQYNHRLALENFLLSLYAKEFLAKT